MVLIHCLKFPSACWAKTISTAAAVVKPIRFLNQQRRLQSTNNYCPNIEPKCGDRFQQKPCDSRQLQIQRKQPAPEPLPKEKRTIKLERPKECCSNICFDVYPRFDLLYYKRTDKLNREYEQTWAECAEPIRKPKAICCLNKVKQPKLKKRPPRQRPQTACVPTCSTSKPKCPFTTSTGCRPAMHPPKCKIIRSITNCIKQKAPFPAFSECSRKLKKPKHPIECRCLLAPSVYEMWSYHHYMQRIKKTGLC